jgi:hypothetical protein
VSQRTLFSILAQAGENWSLILAVILAVILALSLLSAPVSGLLATPLAGVSAPAPAVTSTHAITAFILHPLCNSTSLPC